jgi:hypothetical protein
MNEIDFQPLPNYRFQRAEQCFDVIAGYRRDGPGDRRVAYFLRPADLRQSVELKIEQFQV